MEVLVTYIIYCVMCAVQGSRNCIWNAFLYFTDHELLLPFVDEYCVIWNAFLYFTDHELSLLVNQLQSSVHCVTSYKVQSTTSTET